MYPHLIEVEKKFSLSFYFRLRGFFTLYLMSFFGWMLLDYHCLFLLKFYYCWKVVTIIERLLLWRNLFTCTSQFSIFAFNFEREQAMNSEASWPRAHHLVVWVHHHLVVPVHHHLDHKLGESLCHHHIIHPNKSLTTFFLIFHITLSYIWLPKIKK